MHKRILAFLIMVLILVSFSATASAAENLVSNPGLELDNLDKLSNWETSAWYDSEDVTTFTNKGAGLHGNCVTITNNTENDARYTQLVNVDPDATYHLSAYVKASGGKDGKLGANVSIMDVIAKSNDYNDTKGEWVKVELYGRTGEDQTEATVALRLGGYGGLNVGTASFDDVVFEKVDNVPAGFTALDLKTPEAQKSDTFKMDWVPFQILLALAMCFIVYVLYRRHLAREMTLTKRTGGNTSLYMIIIVAVTLRMILAATQTAHGDMYVFKNWADLINKVGFPNFYTSGVYTDYPPGYMYVLYVLGAIRQLLGIPASSKIFDLIMRMPSIITDVIAAWFIYRMCRENMSHKASLILFALFAFNPAIILNSSIWGQTDSFYVLFIVLSFYFLNKDKKIWATVMFVIAVLLKPQALVFGPVFALPFLGDFKDKGVKEALIQLLYCVTTAIAVFFLAILPFKGSQQPLWILDKYLNTANQFPYAVLNSFNFFALVGGNWASDSKILWLFDYKTWGTIFIIAIIACSAILYLKKRDKKHIFLIAGFLMAGIFVFGQYMHERYMYPAIIMLLLAFVQLKDKRILVAFTGFSATMLVNTGAVLVNGNFKADDPVLLIFSLINVILFIILAKTCYDIIIRDKTKLPELPKEEAAEDKEEEKKEIQPMLELPEEGKIRMSMRDRVLLIALTVVYSAFALVNLGSTNVPETYWRPGKSTEKSIVVDFGQEKNIKYIYYYGGIGEGKIKVEASLDGTSYENATEINESMDNMYNWTKADAGFKAKTVRISTEDSNVWLYEMAFLDDAGNFVDTSVAEKASLDKNNLSMANIFDEKETLVPVRSFMTGMYFDEVYHARTAFEHLNGIRPYENSHPPLGKIFIMTGIAIFGMNPFGWRIIGTLFGIAMIPLLYFLALRIFKKTKYAFTAAFIFAFDFMHFAQTRIATIDVYGVFFIIAMFYFMYRFYCTNFYSQKLSKVLVPLGLAGLMFGLGSASKWIGIYAGGGLAFMLGAYIYKRYKEHRAALAALGNGADPEDEKDAAVFSAANDFWKKTVILLAFCVVTFIIIPVAIYIASYIPYMLVTEGAAYDLKGIWGVQEFMYSYHSGLTATHPFASQWWSWPFDVRPVWYYMGTDLPAGTVAGISSFGNPIVWLGGLASFIYVTSLAVRRKIKKHTGLFLVFVGIAANFLPWVIVTRATFIYHYFATVPFIVLATVFMFKYLEDKGKSKKWRYIYMGGVLLLFVLFYPLLSGMTIPRWYADLLKWVPSWTLFA